MNTETLTHYGSQAMAERAYRRMLFNACQATRSDGATRYLYRRTDGSFFCSTLLGFRRMMESTHDYT